jgi:hypothetical protein
MSCQSLTGCASIQYESENFGYSVHELNKIPNISENDIIVVHGFVSRTTESIVIKDENCPEQMTTLVFTDKLESTKNGKEFFNEISKQQMKSDNVILFASMRVRPALKYSGETRRVAYLKIEEIIDQKSDTKSHWDATHKLAECGNS